MGRAASSDGPPLTASARGSTMPTPEPPSPPQYRVEVVAVGTAATEGVPVIRLRRWLKIGLRAFGLRAIRVEEVKGGTVERPFDECE
jgi:hypothetical protein